jgi:CHAT domain-containing protein
MSSRVASRRALILLVLAARLITLASCGRLADGANVSRLDRTLFGERFSIGRLAGEANWQPCSDTIAARSACAPPPTSVKTFQHLASEARSFRQQLDSDSSLQALHSAALLSLRLRDSISTGLDDAARFLDRASRIAPASVAVLNDLAVVQLQLGEREQRVGLFLSALDVLERSVAADSTNATALFNRALVLERLHLLVTAQKAWVRYLTVEHDPSWRREARAHIAFLARETQSAILPQGGRDAVFQLLGDWGHAISSHDEARAAALLETAHGIVATLDTVHGDQSLRLAIARVDSQVRLAIRSHANQSTLARLAAAHAEFADAFLTYKRPSYENAEAGFTHAESELRAVGSPLAGWAELYRASSELNLGKYEAAEQRLLRVAARATPQQPALAGKAIWTHGVIEVRRGHFELANQLYVAAAPYMARAHEPENEGAISHLIAESLISAGQYSAGEVHAYRALALLAPYRKSDFLNNHLGTVERYAHGDSLPHAALTVTDELLKVAIDQGSLDALALTYRNRARDLIALGRRDSAFAELATGLRAIVPLIGHAKERYQADIQLVQGQILRTADPRGALPLLESVAGAYQRLGVYSKASAALYETAIAARDAGDTARAQQLLGQAIRQIEQQQMTFESSEGRAALFETADNAFDAMIGLQFDAGRADSAFLYLERERAAAKLSSLQSGPGRDSGAIPTLEAIRAAVPPDMLFVEYALLPDRILAWTASKKGTNHYTLKTPRDTIADLVRDFLRDKSIPTPRDGDPRSRLYEALLRSLSKDLAGIGQITIVCDRDLSRLPFAALWDLEAQQYLIERYRVRTEPSAAFFLAAQRIVQRRKEHPKALVVGNPSVDTATVRLEALPGAENEARRVANIYPKATLLTGDAARRDTVLDLLQGAEVFHFAGHAVFNADRPELSYLALTSPRDPNASGALTAREIGNLRLSNLEIVVLSACQTLSSRTTRTGGVAGLASSFLRAGAPATISTLWDVSDDVTGPLLVAFHQRFASGLSGAEALRQAQLAALRRQPGQRAAPALWAAFVYAGP